jgi:DNA invertase Pin-like site-specific DNA recombinase
MDLTQDSGDRTVIMFPQVGQCQNLVSQARVRSRATASSCGTVARMDLAYCRVSTTAQDLARQIDAVRAAGVAEEHTYVDKRTGANMDREGLTALLAFARPGDRINVLTLDRLGRNMRETLNLVHDLTQRGIHLRTLGDKLAVDTSEPGPGTEMAIALLAMFAQMERIYMLERAAGARAAKEARGLPAGRPTKLNATTRAGAAQRIKNGAIPEQVAAELSISRSTLYRELRKHRESAAIQQVTSER